MYQLERRSKRPLSDGLDKACQTRVEDSAAAAVGCNSRSLIPVARPASKIYIRPKVDTRHGVDLAECACRRSHNILPPLPLVETVLLSSKTAQPQQTCERSRKESSMMEESSVRCAGSLWLPLLHQLPGAWKAQRSRYEVKVLVLFRVMIQDRPTTFLARLPHQSYSTEPKRFWKKGVRSISAHSTG